jgi:glycosyltransferase involved in cell wall biosynthesis
VSSISVTVVVPTRNRPASLREALAGLSRQDAGPASYEVVVVDDGSLPPVSLPGTVDPLISILRLEGVERSAARNAGASRARGNLLVFLDDDMAVREDFVRLHIDAQNLWPGALVVGAVRLPDQVRATPFGHFRQALENTQVPAIRGWVTAPNFCTAQNMSIPATLFGRLGGFDPGLSSSEDQDLALRHTAGGGRIAFLPEAEAVHRDWAVDIRAYCRRTEWGSEHMIPFCRRYPDRPDTVDRARINGPLNWPGEPLPRNLRRLAKSLLTARPMIEALFRLTEALEHHWPQEAMLDRLYRLLLGAHIFRGYRRGLLCEQSAALDPVAGA